MFTSGTHCLLHMHLYQYEQHTTHPRCFIIKSVNNCATQEHALSSVKIRVLLALISGPANCQSCLWVVTFVVYRQQSSPLLYSIDIWSAPSSRLTHREMNHHISFVHLEQSPIGRCGLPWAKTAPASKWPLRTTWALLFWHTWPAAANWTLLLMNEAFIDICTFPTYQKMMIQVLQISLFISIGFSHMNKKRKGCFKFVLNVNRKFSFLTI